jgi:hypothetical protein
MTASYVVLVCGSLIAAAACAGQPFEFTRMVAHWADYADPGYLPFIEDAKPELVQVGFYGAHFWSLADTPFGSGYPAHFPVRGHRECAQWFKQLNAEVHKRGAKVVGHMNVKFLVGDPENPEGPRGFFRFYRNQWDETLLGRRPTADPQDLLEKDRLGKPISNQTYSIGGMREYWACLNNPHWREVLKAWLRFGLAQGVDGFIASYFYRHDCHCSYCVAAWRAYLRERFTPAQLKEQFAINDLESHVFEEILAWHNPAQSTPLRREMLRFSQIANKNAFDEVFVRFGRSLKPDLIVAQWNHLGDFNQISGDERCLLPGDLWGRDEDYLWYSTGDAANLTDIPAGILGEATLQARYIRGAFHDKPFTLGKYENTRVRVAIAELAANGGAPMGFYTDFKSPDARRELLRYYAFLRQHERLYRGNQSHAEVLLIFPRTRVHDGDVAAVARFKEAGKHLLDNHVLFDILADDQVPPEAQLRYAAVIVPSESGFRPAEAKLPARLSQFKAPATVRVSASRPASADGITLHFVNYNRHEPADKKLRGKGIADEKPISAPAVETDFNLPFDLKVRRIEFLTPENDQARQLEFQQTGSRLRFVVPEFLVYGVVQIHTSAEPAVSPKTVAAIVTVYHHNSHADVIAGRLLRTDTLDDKGKHSPLRLVSLYVDQRPTNDLSRGLAASHGFRLCDTIEDALTLGTGRLAVEGVLLIAEHGDYPKSATGNTQYPKRQFWAEVLNVFRHSGRVVPVFIDKHLADNWTDAKFIYDSARELKVPLMAGSSLPTTWRRPPADVPRGARLNEIVAITYHTTDAYGFHALEFGQALAEQRHGGETGVKAVQSFSGDAVWRAFDKKTFDTQLFDAAWKRLSTPRDRGRPLREIVRNPRLFRVEYADGLRAHLLELNAAAGEWSAAWRYADDKRVDSSLFWTQEGRPAMHFTWLLNGIEQMMLTGKPSWNVERTLLTSGVLDALLLSLRENDRRIDTPYLMLSYEPIWRWKEPPPPPPMRPWAAQ